MLQQFRLVQLSNFREKRCKYVAMSEETELASCNLSRSIAYTLNVPLTLSTTVCAVNHLCKR